MDGKIALEEHFAIEATLGDSEVFGAHVWPDLRSRLVDIQTRLVDSMDAYGLSRIILSLNAPAVQAIADPKRAMAVAQEANDALAEHVSRRSDRFSAFAALPLQEPDAAIQELERCVKELKFVGALVNGFTDSGDPNNLLYYDLPQYRPFWKAVENSTCRSICIREIRCLDKFPGTEATIGCSARIGLSTLKPRYMLCGS